MRFIDVGKDDDTGFSARDNDECACLCAVSAPCDSSLEREYIPFRLPVRIVEVVLPRVYRRFKADGLATSFVVPRRA